MERLALGYSLIALMVAAILGVVIYLRRNTREQTDRRQRLKDDLQYEERLRKNADETDKEAK
jgi:cbb3-type cytochrome oxidase subunit 3